MADEIFHKVRVKAPPREVYAAITEPARLGQWWLHATPGERDGTPTLKFGPDEGFEEMLLRELRPYELVRWAPTEVGMSDWLGTEIEFRLMPHEGSTIVHFKHSRWRDDVALYPHYSVSWAVFLLSLRDLIETGEGMPYPNRFIRA